LFKGVGVSVFSKYHAPSTKAAFHISNNSQNCQTTANASQKGDINKEKNILRSKSPADQIGARYNKLVINSKVSIISESAAKRILILSCA
jgi:hypothetical protein